MQGGVWGETWCPGFVSVCTTAWAEIVSRKGTDETLVVAENAFVVPAMCLICLIWVGPATKLRGLMRHTRNIERPCGWQGGGAAILGQPNVGIPATGFRTTVVGIPATGVLADCVCGTICRA